MLNFCDFIQICIFTSNHHLNLSSAKKQPTKFSSAKFYKCYISYKNSKTRGQTLKTQMRRLIMNRHIWIYSVFKFCYFHFSALEVYMKTLVLYALHFLVMYILSVHDGTLVSPET